MRRAISLAILACGCGSGASSSPDAGAPDVRPPDDAAAPDAGFEIAEVEPGEMLAAGSVTAFDTGRGAYRQPLTGLAGAARTSYLGGQVLFDVDWVAAPSGVTDRDGLGPTFNAVSCAACHISNGRGAPPIDDGPLVTALLRVSAPDGSPDPIYGDQIEPRAITGVPAEATVVQRYTAMAGSYADGTPYELLAPSVEVTWGLGDPGPILTSVRTAQATIGGGLLEAIPVEAITAAADSADLDGDGISGRPRWLDGGVLGRFGWKAGQPSILGQTAAALIGDLGLTTSVHPAENCPAPQTACAASPSGGAPELEDARLAALRAFGVGTSVPARRDVADPTVLRGKWLFRELACTKCHTPRWETGDHDFPGIGHQVIWPYTDLLLHDMGEGLADHRPEGDASGTEWRTAPLWGIGLMSTVNGHTRLLHDGRARNFAEAILWHGGEAAQSSAKFRALPARDRAALEAFLQSL